MATTTNLMSWEAFEQLPDGDGYHRELIEGELQVLPPPKSRHTRVAHYLYRLMLAIEGRADVHVYMEAGYKLSTDPPSWVQPDISVLRNAPRRETKGEDHFLGAPELAVEVVSPSETASDLNRKVELMLGHGALAVWVVYTEQSAVRVFRTDGSATRHIIGDTLSLPDLLPGWDLPVARIFED